MTNIIWTDVLFLMICCLVLVPLTCFISHPNTWRFLIPEKHHEAFNIKVRKTIVEKVPIDHLGPITADTTVTFAEAYSYLEQFESFKLTIPAYGDVIVHGKIKTPKISIMDPPSMDFTIELIAIKDTKYFMEKFGRMISIFETKKFGELSIVPMTNTDIELLTNRGHRVLALTDKSCYVHGHGKFYHEFGSIKQKILNIDSRVMVDTVGFYRFEGVQSDSRISISRNNFEIYNMNPMIPVFSFDLNVWGYMHVDDLREIDFNEEIFDRIFLPSGQKEIIKPLVTNFYKIHTHDLFSNKQKGLIFLLGGPTGTGKTITVNALAELAHISLYKIGADSLGHNGEQIEKNLRQILDMVASWNGILLIDEADVFLRQRGTCTTIAVCLHFYV
jgi:hypothetical protein